MACRERCWKSESERCSCSCKGKKHGYLGYADDFGDFKVKWYPSKKEREKGQLRLFTEVK